MEIEMSADSFTKELRSQANTRLFAHVTGFIGANLVFASLFLWGLPLLSWLHKGIWEPSAFAEALIAAPTMLVAQAFGLELVIATVLVDAAAGFACLVCGLFLLVIGARVIAQRPAP
jgi:hypothetical protein